MRFEPFDDEIGVAIAAADVLQETLVGRRDARVILPAGRTPLAFFTELRERARARRIDLSRARFFQLDEYVGAGSGDRWSFHSLLRAQLLDPLRRRRDQDFLLDGRAKDPRAEIERHAARLAELGGADVAFLGLGRNGHVAFNEPGTSPDSRARVVELARATRLQAQADGLRGKPPTHGMTLGLHEIRSARRLALLVTGAAKAGILAALFDEPPSAQRPASLLLDHPRFTILADEAAAAHLHEPPAGAEERRDGGRPAGSRSRARDAVARG